MKKFLVCLILLTMCGFVVSAGAADEPFRLDLRYDQQQQSLEVSLDRLSRDEVEDAMQKLTIYTNADGVKMEENLTNQNHLNTISKQIPLAGSPGDKIYVELHYGEGKVLKKMIVIPGKVKDVDQETETETEVEVLPATESKSLLISDDSAKAFPAVSRTDRVAPLTSNDRRVSYGYPDPHTGDYGQKGYGYEPGNEQFGYDLEEYEQKEFDSTKPFTTGYTFEPYGYRDAGHLSAEKALPYGEQGEYGYEGDKAPYGRSGDYDEFKEGE